ncbi:uncharacterized protein N7477_005782 [Penicillium maclennaniae]|uniref:uncharacterized protein n=1 Tax=Penicillium maclennaniae TaxID=1343394 RepID=UPI002540543C|nr:uncharacterized protein N7477_005782 [Penicillium maclennaniae]KAJ5670419.1 hypothetical protein N7477_005782 [Penicillium maclennaniae]
MPHKHKRREKDDSHFNLPPSVIAKALPVRDPNAKPKINAKNGKKPFAPKKSAPRQQNDPAKKVTGPATTRRKTANEDDTPKAFQRLMQFRETGRRAPSGLETGEKKNKKRKREGEDKETPQKKQTATESKAEPAKEVKAVMPKILPGERLGDFAARVDREMPLSAMTKNNTKGGVKVRDHKMTKHEKHLRKLQAGWREEEAKIKEREQAEAEERAAEMEDYMDTLKEWELEARGGKAKKKGTVPKKSKKKSGTGEDGAPESGDDNPDPWAKLKKRDKERQANPFETAKAPPELIKPREIFKVRRGATVDVANVPNAVGSLRRREELAGERRNIVEEYRRLMAERRGQA